MVNHEQRLDRIFSALTNGTRRAILRQLAATDRASISELAAPSAMTLPAIMKHLDVLEGARLIERAKTGRTMFVRLSPQPMAEAMRWLDHYRPFWTGSLDRLAARAEAEERSGATKR